MRRYVSAVLRRSVASALVAVLAIIGLAGCASSPEAGTPNVTAAAAASAPAGGARERADASDVYVLLSGGGTPLSNNYSQYLQARAMAGFFAREYPPEQTWVFFGVGNREGEPPVLADARRESKRDGTIVQAWLPGTLPRNRPATRDSFLRALREEILPRVRGGGTLYLFVGDHGELAGARDKKESAITMWQLKPSRREKTGWRVDDREVLGVAELRQVLAEGLGRGRVVFGMTQCHSGGFHELGIGRERVPPRAWFVGAPPAWAVGPTRGLTLPIAGFTATDEASPAAGCDADPDPERWAGYERFLPEGLIGLDLMSGQSKGTGAASLAEAHERATLVDHTIDKPRATSEHYLEAWARLIEDKLARELLVTEPVRQAVMAYQKAVDTGVVTARSEGLRERQAQFARFTAELAVQVPDAAKLLREGTRAQLGAPAPRGGRGEGRGGRRGEVAEQHKLWNETLRPAWKAAVESGRAGDVVGRALALERELLRLDEGSRTPLLFRRPDHSTLLDAVYWQSTYAVPARYDPDQAAAVASWGARRRSEIVAWGKAAPDAAVRAAAERIGPGVGFTAEPPRPLSRRTATERVLFYRRVLAAWEFLETLQATEALQELQTLIDLERTPWRRAVSAQ
jgi:hypothetical protein